MATRCRAPSGAATGCCCLRMARARYCSATTWTGPWRRRSPPGCERGLSRTRSGWPSPPARWPGARPLPGPRHPPSRPAWPAGPADRDAERVDLGAGMVATAAGARDNHSVLVHSRDGNPADWAHVRDALGHRPAWSRWSSPRLTPSRTSYSRAGQPAGRGALAPDSRRAPGDVRRGGRRALAASRTGFSSGYQKAGEADPARGGPVITAPDGMVATIGEAGDPTADPLAYHEDDRPARWWRFAPNASPAPLESWLTPRTPPRPAQSPRLRWRPIPAGYHLAVDAPLTHERFLELEAIPPVPGLRRLVIDAEHYADGAELEAILSPEQQDMPGEVWWDTTVVELQSGDPVALAQSRRQQGLPDLSREYLRTQAIRHGIPIAAPGEIVTDAAVGRTHAFDPSAPSASASTILAPPMPLRPRIRLEISPVETVSALGGVPNGVSQRQEAGYPIVWQADAAGRARWRPFAQYMTHRPATESDPPLVHRGAADAAVAARRPPARGACARPAGHLRHRAGCPRGRDCRVRTVDQARRSQDPARRLRGHPDHAALGAGACPHDRRARQAGIRAGMGAGLSPRRTPASPFGQPAAGLSASAHVPRRRGQLRASHPGPGQQADHHRERHLAGHEHRGRPVCQGRYGPRVTLACPLPAHDVPASQTRRGRSRPRASGRTRRLDHGMLPARWPGPHVPACRASAGELGGQETFDLAAQVVVNTRPVDRAYVVVRRDAPGNAAGPTVPAPCGPGGSS